MLPSFKILSFTLNGSYNVNACPIPLCCNSGAMTNVSPKSSTAFLDANIPDAVTPSSFDINIFIVLHILF